jgi:hypothetical protein
MLEPCSATCCDVENARDLLAAEAPIDAIRVASMAGCLPLRQTQLMRSPSGYLPDHADVGPPMTGLTHRRK